MAAGEMMLDPRTLYTGGLAGWIPPWQYPLRRSTKGCKWPSGVVDAKDGAIAEARRVGVGRCCGIGTWVTDEGDQPGAKGQMDGR